MGKVLKVLVISDFEGSRIFYRRLVRQCAGAQYIIREAQDGEEAVALMGRESVDCVLLEYSIAAQSGIEVLMHLRREHPFVPVVMLASQGDEAAAVSAMQAGAQDYIAKNEVTPERLDQAVHAAIERCIVQKHLQEQRNSLEIFTRGLVHDLKEPVRTICSFLHLLEEQETLSEKGKAYFRYIHKAADRMSALIDAVYFYARLDGVGKRVPVESQDLGQVLEEVKENLAEMIHTRHAVITSDPLPCIPGNRMQLMQVMQNLVCNAIRYCEGTPVIAIEAREGADQWLFRVRDNGPGIGVEAGEKIFDPFTRFTHNEEGLGLGLAICKRIVESHGGRIWYESLPQAGATFMFTLPKSTVHPLFVPPALAEESASVLRSDDGEGNQLGNILLVEDNEADIKLAQILLMEQAHFRCNLVVARDVNEAISRLKNDESAAPVDLMLLDINMPGMDGFELLERLRAQSGIQAPPVVMCATSAYDRDMARAKSLGVAGYLTKPAEFRKLYSVINNIAGIRLCQEGEGYVLRRSEM